MGGGTGRRRGTGGAPEGGGYRRKGHTRGGHWGPPQPHPPLCAAVNGTVREELIANKTSEEIAQLATKLANQSGLDVVRIRKPFHTDNPSIQGQWHPLTNKPPALLVRGPRLAPPQ